MRLLLDEGFPSLPGFDGSVLDYSAKIVALRDFDPKLIGVRTPDWDSAIPFWTSRELVEFGHDRQVGVSVEHLDQAVCWPAIIPLRRGGTGIRRLWNG